MAVVLSWRQFCLLGAIWSGDVFGFKSGDKGVLLASGRWRSGMMPNTLQYTGQSPTAKNDTAPNVNSAQFKKLCSKGKHI